MVHKDGVFVAPKIFSQFHAQCNWLLTQALLPDLQSGVKKE